MKLEIKFDKQPKKFLNRLDNVSKQRIYSKIDKVSKNPLSYDLKLLSNFQKRILRTRVGNFRILYEIKLNKIIIILIDKRASVYHKASNKFKEEELLYS